MKNLRKNLLAAAVVTVLGVSTLALAGPGGGFGPGSDGPMGGGPGDCPMVGGGPDGPDGPGGPGGPGGRQGRMAMMQQFHAERMELLEYRLKLKPEQQAAWKTFITAQNAHHAQMAQVREEMRDKEPTTALAQFGERVQFMEQRLANLKTMAKAAGDFYATLDPTQKKVMDDFFLTTRPMHRKMRGFGAPPVSLDPGAQSPQAPQPAQ